MLDPVAIADAVKVIHASELYVKTPILKDCRSIFADDFFKASSSNHVDELDTTENKDSQKRSRIEFCLNLKLENMQTLGSYKIRGVINQLHHAPLDVKEGRSTMVTMSAGNYGKAFAFACSKQNLKGKVVMPETAPLNRKVFIEKCGLHVDQVPSSKVLDTVQFYCQTEGCHLMHSFDDPTLMAGHATAALEILEDVPNVDIVVAGCGGGGFLAGISAAMKIYKPNCLVYGVEPESANTMYRSFMEGQAVTMPEAKSIASGLAPPCAGNLAYQICKRAVQQICLVTEDEIKHAVRVLYNRGLVVEPAGSAAFAALLFGRIPDHENKNIVIIISGGNVTPDEMCKIFG